MDPTRSAFVTHMLDLLKAEDVVPQLKVYVFSNLFLALEHDTDHRNEIVGTQFLVMAEMLELAARHPELVMKMANDLRRYSPDAETMIEQTDYIAQTDQEDVLIVMQMYQEAVGQQTPDLKN